MFEDFEAKELVKDSTVSLLEAMKENKPEDFLKLYEASRSKTPILDKETILRFQRLGLIDPIGNIEEPVRHALMRVNFTLDESSS